MNAAKPGLGDVPSTRPLSREERRAQAARIKAEQDTATTSQEDVDVAPEPTPEKTMTTRTEPPAVQLEPRRKATKQQFGTQLHAATIARIEFIRRHGYSVTDVTDSAINEYLDRAGIPRPAADGRMPD